VKDRTQCAPNGYYFIPVYDKVIFISVGIANRKKRKKGGVQLKARTSYPLNVAKIFC